MKTRIAHGVLPLVLFYLLFSVAARAATPEEEADLLSRVRLFTRLENGGRGIPTSDFIVHRENEYRILVQGDRRRDAYAVAIYFRRGLFRVLNPHRSEFPETRLTRVPAHGELRIPRGQSPEFPTWFSAGGFVEAKMLYIVTSPEPVLNTYRLMEEINSRPEEFRTAHFLKECERNGWTVAAIPVRGVASPVRDPVADGGGRQPVDNSAWRVTVPPEAVRGGGDVRMEALSDQDKARLAIGGFDQVERPLKVTVDGRENVRLDLPATVAIQLPPGATAEKGLEELFFAYLTPKGWEYYFPDKVNLSTGMAEMKIRHFSIFGWGKPSEKDQLDKLVDDMSRSQLDKELGKKGMLEAVEKELDKFYMKIGVESSKIRGQMIADVISGLGDGDDALDSYLVQVGYEAEKKLQGEDTAYTVYTKTMELAAGELIDHFKDGLPEEAGKIFSIVSNTSTYLGAMAEGDSRGAIDAMTNMIMDAVPAGAIVDASIKYTTTLGREMVDFWGRNEIEKAYQIYKTGEGGIYGYPGDLLQGDFDAVFESLQGGQRQFDIAIQNYYIERWGEDAGDQIEARLGALKEKVYRDLKESFEARLQSEERFAEIKAENAEFVRQLKEQGLLEPTAYRDFFGQREGSEFNLGDRLALLNLIRDHIGRKMDKDVAAGLDHDFMVRAIGQWVFWNGVGEPEGFDKYLADSGYVSTEAGPDESDPYVALDNLTGRYREAGGKMGATVVHRGDFMNIVMQGGHIGDGAHRASYDALTRTARFNYSWGEPAVPDSFYGTEYFVLRFSLEGDSVVCRVTQTSTGLFAGTTTRYTFVKVE